MGTSERTYSLQRRGLSGWIVAAGLAVALFSVSSQSQPQENEEEPVPTTLPYTQGYGTADSNNRMIAVTGVDVTGGALLYLVDTETRHLTIYQATGGTKSTMSLKWVGARNIGLDLQVDGWNDKSAYSYKDLVKEFGQTNSVNLPD